MTTHPDAPPVGTAPNAIEELNPELKGLGKLRSLNLASTRVGDAGLAHLLGLAKLADLSLIGTRVSDAGVAKLKGLAKLQMVVVHGTRVTAVGANALRGAVPQVSVIGARPSE